jgi:hypothetical protein
MASTASVRWPERFRPERAPVHVVNEIDGPAPPERIWSRLIRAPLWPSWYSNSSDVRIPSGATALGPGVEFSWRTFSARLRSRVEEFEPTDRLAWSAWGLGVAVYHAWLMFPHPTGCHILTEKSR